MTVKDLISLYCKERGITQTALAQQIEVSKQTLQTTLIRDNGMSMRLSTFIKWLDKMDYQIVIEPINDGEEVLLDGEDDSFLFDEV